MKFVTLPNGNLQFALENDADKETVQDLLAKNAGDDVGFLADLLEDTEWQPNGHLHLVHPEDIAALTGAPILATERDIADDGTVSVPESARVWWFPDYMVLHFGQVLLKEGKVSFMHALPVEETASA